MSQVDLLAFVAAILDDLKVPWMLVGSHAASFYGEPRSTHDVDLVVDLSDDHIAPLLDRIDSARYYLSESALREGRMANLIDTQTGDKVDLFFAAAEPANHAALMRRRYETILGVPVAIASVEDTILAKLRWNRLMGGSERQIRDVRGIVRLQSGSLNWDLLNQEIDASGLRDVWKTEIVRSPEVRNDS